MMSQLIFFDYPFTPLLCAGDHYFSQISVRYQNCLLSFVSKTYVVGTQKNVSIGIEMVLLSTPNICLTKDIEIKEIMTRVRS